VRAAHDVVLLEKRDVAAYRDTRDAELVAELVDPAEPLLLDEFGQRRPAG
jgi:hypothetical protein